MRKLPVILALVCIAASKQPSSSWTLRYSSGVRLTSPLGFTFPLPPGSVNYLTESYATPITQAQALTMTAQIIGAPTFNYLLEPWNTCVNYASVRPYFERVNDQHGSSGRDIIYAPGNYRWWSNPGSIELREGTFTLTVPFVPEQWSDTAGVFGQNDLSGFSAALAQPRYVGMTFGGGCFYGHGVNVDGPASFLVKSFSVQ